jgi:hypothetical protein
MRFRPLKSLLVTDEHGTPRAYPIVAPANHYYRVMTRSDRMPCLVGEGPGAAPASLDCQTTAARPATPPVQRGWARVGG